MRLLVVEDDPDLNRQLTTALSDAGYVVDRAFDGEEGIEVVTGSMFSGKSEELIRRLRRAQIAKQNVQIFKPAIDNRFSDDEIVSHSAMKIASTNVRSSRELLELVKPETEVVGIDEGQFFDPELPAVVNPLADQGKRVIVAGLDQDRDQVVGSLRLRHVLALALALVELGSEVVDDLQDGVGGALDVLEALLENGDRPAGEDVLVFQGHAEHPCDDSHRDVLSVVLGRVGASGVSRIQWRRSCEVASPQRSS